MPIRRAPRTMPMRDRIPVWMDRYQLVPVDKRTDLVLVPRACRERFLPLRHPAGEALRRRQVVFAGLSRVVRPYRIVRNDPDVHLVWCTLAGEGELTWADGRSGRLRPGSWCVIPAHALQSFRSGRQWTCLWFYLADAPRWRALRTRPALVHPLPHHERLCMWAETYLEGTVPGAASSPGLAACAAEAMGCFLEQQLDAGHDDPAQGQRDALDRLWRTVHADLQTVWTTARCAGVLDISVAHLHRLVLRHHACSPMAKVAQLRMACAADLLHATGWPLERIAAQVGYASAFSFSRTFKRVIGHAPSAERQRDG